jgi:hypothetical protein
MKSLKITGLDLRKHLTDFYISKIFPYSKRKFTESEWCVLIAGSAGEWTRIPNPQNRWLADPHLFSDDTDLFLLVEDFDTFENKGRISMVKVADLSNLANLEVVIDRDEHISFPQTFVYQKSIWMSIECFHGGGVPIYQFDSSLKSWTYFTTILPKMNFLDPLIFSYGSKWILLATEKSDFGEDYYSKLVVYY